MEAPRQIDDPFTKISFFVRGQTGVAQHTLILVEGLAKLTAILHSLSVVESGHDPFPSLLFLSTLRGANGFGFRDYPLLCLTLSLLRNPIIVSDNLKVVLCPITANPTTASNCQSFPEILRGQVVPLLAKIN